MRIGAHVSGEAPLDDAVACKADVVQIFLTDPQSWKKPLPRDDAEALITSNTPIYVHAPYLVNVGSANNRIRIPSRKIIGDTLEAAAAVGAAGVIVHGGYIDDGEDVGVGFERWRKTLDSVDLCVPLLIENTAGGGNAITRELDNYGRLWEEIGDYGIGVCLDTCHAWAAGEDLATVADRISQMAGGIDLIHCNDSRDPFGSNRDRHANLGVGEIPLDLILGVIQTANAPVVVETPGGVEKQAADIAMLRKELGIKY
ncbi:MAG TPA: deoxyribonuclease IV [Dehalococcoidia bacterium]|nr:deoxyribonuclease IV [Dehalococcoidia bacterium]